MDTTRRFLSAVQCWLDVGADWDNVDTAFRRNVDPSRRSAALQAAESLLVVANEKIDPRKTRAALVDRLKQPAADVIELGNDATRELIGAGCGDEARRAARIVHLAGRPFGWRTVAETWSDDAAALVVAVAAAGASTVATRDLPAPALNGETPRENTGAAPDETSEIMPQKTATLPACPACDGPRRAEVGDAADRLCAKCRSSNVVEKGSLLEVRTLIDGDRRHLLDELPHWRELRHFGRLRWGRSEFDANPLELLLDWLAAEHGKPAHAALFLPRVEVVDLLRGAAQPTAPAADAGSPTAPTADTSTVRTKGKRTATDPVLSERAQEVLLAIQREEAFTSDGRVTTEVVANAVGGPKADRQQFTRAMRELKGLGLVDARVGRGGGVWLTVAGARRAAKL